jgi:3-hydroxyacyl-CoA dehydrogenase/enoyl-CoA hydratase/3-hydroxybutyryl-CoA epimerase
VSRAFRLDQLGDGLATLTFDEPDKKVNVFSRPVLAELDSLIGELGQRDEIRCLVLRSGKRGNFIAGADIEEIANVSDAAEAEAGVRIGQRLFNAWSALPFPTIAAVRGSCVGGGMELALASDHILISDRDDVRIGLPEVRLGILPAWGGCSRLPARVGLAAALDIILAGKTVRPYKAFKIGLADALLPDAAFGHQVREFARRLLAGETPTERRGDLKELLLEKNPVGRKLVFDQARKQVMRKTGGLYPAPLRAIEVVKVGVEKGLQAGLDAEARAAAELAISPTCKNLVHLFHLMEETKQNSAAPDAPPVRSAAVIGAGVMGGGIAQLLAGKADLPVRLKEIAVEPLASGMEHAAGLFVKQVKRRWLSRPEAKRKMALLRPTLDYAGFGSVDFVIEAVVERLDVKQKVFAQLAEQVPEDAVLASNTSSLSIDLIGADTPHPERVVGMHFFNPVHKMPLVEVIAGTRTSEETANRVVALCRRLGKTPVVVKDGPGFLVNRLLMFSMAEALWLLDEGYAIEEIDRIMKDWGLPVGPLTLTDEVGIDVAVHVARIIGDAFSDRLALPGWLDRLSEDGRLGVKAGKGIYRYEKGERKGVDSDVYKIIGRQPSRTPADPDVVADRLILPMVNEAARCLDEGVVTGAGALDLAMIMGTGFPPFRGGLLRWADGRGLAGLGETMQKMSLQVAPRFAPSEAFTRRAERGGFYS